MLRSFAKQVMESGLGPVAKAMPTTIVKWIVGEATVGLGVAVCLHRVLENPRPFMLQPELAHTSAEIDAFLDCFADVPTRLTMSFDDGYEDARQYIASRAPHHPDVTWLFMICPEKTDRRFGFSWDAARRAGETDPEAFADAWRARVNRETEHENGLTALADDDDYRLSTVQQCQQLAQMPNVELGDHTDHHIPTAWMSDVDVRNELTKSRERFSMLFGPPKHFAFPYGTPDLFVLKRDIEIAKETHATTTWTVDVQPFRAEDFVQGAVLPRFAWNSKTKTPKEEALYIALKCIAFRTKRRLP